jgi:hypothetical protein
MRRRTMYNKWIQSGDFRERVNFPSGVIRTTSFSFKKLEKENSCIKTNSHNTLIKFLQPFQFTVEDIKNEFFPEKVKEQYKKLSLQLHPDRGFKEKENDFKKLGQLNLWFQNLLVESSKLDPTMKGFLGNLLPKEMDISIEYLKNLKNLFFYNKKIRNKTYV